MGRRAWIAAVALAVAQPQAVWASGAHRSPRTPTHTARSARPPRPAAERTTDLARAKAAMAALVRDRSRRRFHHNWERAIAGLVHAAQGRDRPAALYEAARARYALYRWS